MYTTEELGPRFCFLVHVRLFGVLWPPCRYSPTLPPTSTMTLRLVRLHLEGPVRPILCSSVARRLAIIIGDHPTRSTIARADQEMMMESSIKDITSNCYSRNSRRGMPIKDTKAMSAPSFVMLVPSVLASQKNDHRCEISTRGGRALTPRGAHC